MKRSPYTPQIRILLLLAAALLFTFGGAAMIFRGWRLERFQRVLATQGIVLDARVVGKRHYRQETRFFGMRHRYRMTLRFATPDGRALERERTVVDPAFYGRTPIGSLVQIRCSPARSEDFIVESDRAPDPGRAYVAGAALILIGLGLALFALRERLGAF